MGTMIGPLKAVALAALTAAGLLMATAIKVSDPAATSHGIATTERHAPGGDDLHGGPAADVGAGF